LRHNLRLLLDMAEVNIHSLDRKIKHAKDTMANLAHEREKLTKQVASEDGRIFARR
jgi:hypothetical protein